MPVNYNFTAASEKRTKDTWQNIFLVEKKTDSWRIKFLAVLTAKGERGQAGTGNKYGSAEPLFQLL